MLPPIMALPEQQSQNLSKLLPLIQFHFNYKVKAFVASLFFLLLLTFSANAEEREVDEELVREISYMLRCPICQGLSVAESHSEISENMKGKIRGLLKDGKSVDDVLQFFEERYGEWILRSPRKTGINLLLWIIPFGLIGVLVTGFFLYIRWKKPVRQLDGDESAGSKLSSEEEALIQEEMKLIDNNY